MTPAAWPCTSLAGGPARARSTSRVAELMNQVQADGHRRRHRHRPHPLGHARRAGGAQRAPALQPRPGRGRGRSGPGRVALVHNGIIENHDELRAELQAARLRVHQPDRHRGDRPPGRQPTTATCSTPCKAAVAAARRLRHCRVLQGRAAPRGRRARRLAADAGRGHRDGENFLASDAMALAGVTDQIVYLEEGDVVDLQLGATGSRVDKAGPPAVRARRSRRCTPTAARPSWAPTATTCRRKSSSSRAPLPTRSKAWRASCPSCSATAPPRSSRASTGADPGLRHQLLQRLHRQVLAGEHRQDPHQVEIASEYRYRDSVPDPRTLVVTISQSGETADTLAALKHARSAGHDAHADHLQRGHQRHGARMQAGLHHARRRRDRRGQHQGLHHPAGRPVPADAGAGQAARPPERCRRRPAT
jgi:glucosamine--fructose-6-phosphate aminotransferase (isomerizing)